MAKLTDLNAFKLCWGCWQEITQFQAYDTIRVGKRTLPIHKSCIGKETVSERHRKMPWPPVDGESETGHDGDHTTTEGNK